MATTTVVKTRQRPLSAGQLAANIADVDTFPKLRAARRPTTGTRGRPGMATDMNGAPSVNAVAARPHPRRHTGSPPATRARDYVEVLVHVRPAPNTLPEVFDGFLRTEPAVPAGVAPRRRPCTVHSGGTSLRAGDMLARNAPLPVDVHPGDLLAMPWFRRVSPLGRLQLQPRPAGHPSSRCAMGQPVFSCGGRPLRISSPATWATDQRWVRRWVPVPGSARPRRRDPGPEQAAGRALAWLPRCPRSAARAP